MPHVAERPLWAWHCHEAHFNAFCAPAAGICRPALGGLHQRAQHVYWLQVYAEVLDWDPPTCDGRPVVALGGVALPAAVTAPALLPPPARAGAEAAAHPANPLPLVAGANTPRGAFFEVPSHCLLAGALAS